MQKLLFKMLNLSMSKEEMDSARICTKYFAVEILKHKKNYLKDILGSKNRKN